MSEPRGSTMAVASHRASGRRWRCVPAALAAVAVAGCGDNLVPGIGPPLAPADMLVVIAHFDDDLLFMQPELRAQIATGSLTTVYVSSGDAVYGNAHAEHLLSGSMAAYASVAGSSDWNCGYLMLGDAPIHHCRLRDRPISLIGLDTADGGLPGNFPDSPLHLVEHEVSSIPILGAIGGRATVDSIVDSLREILIATRPAQIHTLDLAATHGHDHSGHLFSSAFLLWATARAGYAGPIRWHRGYNVDSEPITLADADYEAARPMVGYYDACYLRCGPCGTSCPTIDMDHEKWLRRQYSSPRSPIAATGALALDDTDMCVVPALDGTVALGDCATAPPVHLEAGGHLAIGGGCLASGPGNGDPIHVERCRDTPEQYWLVDDGMAFNGRPPLPAPHMDFDHVRCLSPGVIPSAALGAAVCGEHLQPRWQFLPIRSSGAAGANEAGRVTRQPG